MVFVVLLYVKSRYFCILCREKQRDTRRAFEARLNRLQEATTTVQHENTLVGSVQESQVRRS